MDMAEEKVGRHKKEEGDEEGKEEFVKKNDEVDRVAASEGETDKDNSSD